MGQLPLTINMERAILISMVTAIAVITIIIIMAAMVKIVAGIFRKLSREENIFPT